MFSLKPAFDRVNERHRGIDSLTLLFWAVAIDNNIQRQDKERRRRNQDFRQQQQRRELKRQLAGPRPF